MIDLYTAATTNGLRASIMLEELELPYRVHVVELGTAIAAKPPELVKANPAGTIPTLIDHAHGVSISQSFAIMQYLCEREVRFLGSEAKSRAATLQWMSFVMTDIISATHPIFVLGVQLSDTPPAIIEHYEARLMRYLGQADAQLAQTRYLAGGAISVADFALFPTAHFRRPLIERSGGVPHLLRWLEDVGSRPGVQRGMAVPTAS